jgi:hypothetical protein
MKIDISKEVRLDGETRLHECHLSIRVGKRHIHVFGHGETEEDACAAAERSFGDAAERLDRFAEIWMRSRQFNWWAAEHSSSNLASGNDKNIAEQVDEDARAYFKATATRRGTARVHSVDWYRAVKELEPKLEATDAPGKPTREEFFVLCTGVGAIRIISDPTVPPNEIRWETL